MVTTKLVYTADIDDVADPTFSYGAIPLLGSDIATPTQQLDIYITRKGSTNSTLLADGPGYSLDTSEKDVTLQPAVNLQVGDNVTIERNTGLDSRIVDFAQLAFLDSEQVNADSDNLLHLIQEVETNTSEAMRKSVDNLSWDAEGLPIVNGSSAQTGNGFVTLSQVNAIIADSEVANIQNAFSATRDGNGSQPNFTFPGFPVSDVDPRKILVSIDGVAQLPKIGGDDNDYDYQLTNGTPTVLFTTAPPDGSTVFVRTFEGAVQATLDSDSIDGSAVVDKTLPISKIDGESGTNNRWLKFDASGTPSAETLQTQEITNFDTSVEGKRLDQFEAPDSDLSVDNNKITDLRTGASGTSDACTVSQMEQFVDNNAQVAGSTYGTVPSSGEFSSGTKEQTINLGSGNDGTYILFITVTDDGTGTANKEITVDGVTRDFENENPQIWFTVTSNENISVEVDTNGFGQGPLNIRRIAYMRIA